MGLPVTPYCSVDQVRAKLRNRETIIETEILDAIGAASRFVDDWLNRDFGFHDFSITPFRVQRDHIFADELILPFRPILTLTAVSYGGVPYVLDTDYFLPVDNRGRVTTIQMIAGVWPQSVPPLNLILVTGTFGYLQTDRTGAYSPFAIPTGLPSNITEATAEIAVAMTGRNQKEIIGSDGVKQTITDTTIPKTALAILGARKPILI